MVLRSDGCAVLLYGRLLFVPVLVGVWLVLVAIFSRLSNSGPSPSRDGGGLAGDIYPTRGQGYGSRLFCCVIGRED